MTGEPPRFESPLGPIDGARGLPNAAYTSPELFAAEARGLFADTWVAIGSASDIAEPGDHLPLSWMGAPLVMLRDDNDVVRVFHNVCRHRGNELVSCAGKASVLRCSYHSWTYGLDGALRRTPQIGGHGVDDDPHISQADLGLIEVRTACWLDVVFVNLSGDAIPFDEHVEPLQQRLGALASASDIDELRPAADHGAKTFQYAANWKLCVENNLESYHLPWVHPDLNAVSKLDAHYEFFDGPHIAGQGSSDYDDSAITTADLRPFSGWPPARAEYPTLYPNLFLGFQNNHIWTRIIEPVAPDLTRDHLRTYYLGDASTDAALEPGRAAIFDAWQKVFLEDVGVVEGMQRGRNSPAFDGGVFAPERDRPTHHFARWVAARIAPTGS